MADKNPLDPLAARLGLIVDSPRDAAGRLPEVWSEKFTGTRGSLPFPAKRYSRGLPYHNSVTICGYFGQFPDGCVDA